MQYRKTTIAQDISLPVSTTVSADMGVNPISHLIVTMRGLNVTDEATLTEMLTRFGQITVTRFGETIFNMSAIDLQKHNAIMFKRMPILANQVATDNGTRFISLIVPFSREIYNPSEGLPKTLRGELQVQVTSGTVDTAIDNVTLQIEQVEMLDASPKRFMKTTTLSQTMVSGVENNIALPIGNEYAGIVIFSTTIPTGTAFTTTADKMKLLIDNVENTIVTTQWESAHGELLNRVGHSESYDASVDNDDVANYALLDFSPRGTDDFVVQTKGKTQATLSITAGDGNAVRAMISELVAN
jgi:hypothetical protein